MTKDQVFDFHFSLYELMEWAKGICELLAPHIGHYDVDAQEAYAQHDAIYRKASTLWMELEPIVDGIREEISARAVSSSTINDGVLLINGKAPHELFKELNVEDKETFDKAIKGYVEKMMGELDRVAVDTLIKNPNLTDLQQKSTEGTREKTNQIKSFDEWKERRESKGCVYINQDLALEVYREYKRVMIMRNMQQSKANTPYIHMTAKGAYESNSDFSRYDPNWGAEEE